MQESCGYVDDKPANGGVAVVVVGTDLGYRGNIMSSLEYVS
jgi:hypothetical protein